MLLATSTAKIQLITSAATNVRVAVEWADNDNGGGATAVQSNGSRFFSSWNRYWARALASSLFPQAGGPTNIRLATGRLRRSLPHCSRRKPARC